jgi:DNA-binding winged helix-turn-helix (wHTH) protein/tetratricopeptide (TPR) repeat protein
VAGPDYQFGPFAVDRARYRVNRGDDVVQLTPKLLDLLLHLLDHSDTLVTKEQLLDAVWPGVNVTDNSLAHAVSELRQALGDDASTPRFIKTVTRRGYRFIGPVSRIETAPASCVHLAADSPDAAGPSIAVLGFENVTGDRDAAWLSAGLAETVTGDLRALGRFRVVDRTRVGESVRRASESSGALAAELGTAFLVTGSFQRHGDRIRITARIIEARTGEAVAEAKIDGLLAEIFALQDRVVEQFARQLGIVGPVRSKTRGPAETPSLAAYRAFTEGWLHLETLDIREIPHAIARFERAIEIDPHYALAFAGLANAQVAAYEQTRAENAPARATLSSAIGHARRAVQQDESLAEAHATLAFALVSDWATAEALPSARRAVALESTNWRHFFRLGHAAWGGERLRAAEHTLALYPDFAFAHFQTAMVHVARGHLREAEIVLRQGAAVADRQVSRGDRYPALGLHWLLGLVRLAQDDVEEALRELDREQQLAQPHRLYGREYRMCAFHGRGACLLRAGRLEEAAASFRQALSLYPDHAPSTIGAALALRAIGALEAADAARERARAILDNLGTARPIEAAMVHGQMLAVAGRPAEADAVLCHALDDAPPGFAGWTIPVEPLLTQPVHPAETQRLTGSLRRLSERAR